jgi:hypothetical protein
VVDWVEGKEKDGNWLHGKLWSRLTYLVLGRYPGFIGGSRVRVQSTGRPGDGSSPLASGKRGKGRGQEGRDEGESSRNEEEAPQKRRREKENVSRLARKGRG